MKRRYEKGRGREGKEERELNGRGEVGGKWERGNERGEEMGGNR